MHNTLSYCIKCLHRLILVRVIGVGFCEDHVPLDRMLGWDQGSWGYHGDDGKVFAGGFGSKFGTPYGKNETIGCGVNFEKETAFFTKGGKLIGE